MRPKDRLRRRYEYLRMPGDDVWANEPSVIRKFFGEPLGFSIGIVGFLALLVLVALI